MLINKLINFPFVFVEVLWIALVNEWHIYIAILNATLNFLFVITYENFGVLLGNSSTGSGSSDPGGRKARTIARPLRRLYVVPTLLLFIFTLFCLPSSSISLSYFIIAVPTHKCCGQHSCMSSYIFSSHTEWNLLLSLCDNGKKFWERCAV